MPLILLAADENVDKSYVCYFQTCKLLPVKEACEREKECATHKH